MKEGPLRKHEGLSRFLHPVLAVCRFRDVNSHPGAYIFRGVASPKIECTHLYSTKMANSRGRSRNLRKRGGGRAWPVSQPQQAGGWPPEAVGFYMLTGALFTVS